MLDLLLFGLTPSQSRSYEKTSTIGTTKLVESLIHTVVKGRINGIHDWLVVWNMNFIFRILGNSSSQLTNSYFFRGWLNHQADCVESYNC